ncbi:MAG: hypothetical protein H6765_09365 [Candidatus Peribacteria bacterium]|nr:MAG: hypothetical protein H6765_09365 [Candidatus Peribacteria bacterium]
MQGGVNSVEVSLNGDTYTATINGNVWSVTIPLVPVINNITVVAHPNDTDCDDVQTTITIKYHPDICVDPITNLTIDSHGNGQMVSSSPIDLFGTVE